MTQPELSQLISENAFVCINLIYQFSKLVRMSSVVSAMAGVTHRIMEMVEVMRAPCNYGTKYVIICGNADIPMASMKYFVVPDYSPWNRSWCFPLLCLPEPRPLS